MKTAAVMLWTLLAASPGQDPIDGPWTAWLDSPGGRLGFTLVLSRTEGPLEAHIVNGPERIRIPRVELLDGELLLAMDHYDSRIRARIGPSGRTLEGEWEKLRGQDQWVRMDFHASLASAARAAPASDPGPHPFDFGGRWAVDFEHDEYPAVASFTQAPDGRLNGTFLTALGDYRFLAGRSSQDTLELSCFDGAHAFLFKARALEDGSLSGDFWSRDAWHETWTAKRDPKARLLDPFELTRWNDKLSLSDYAFPDTDGKLRKLTDPAFAGKARLLQVFGTWCPNCHDEAPYLAELDRRYRARGLSILALAFELTGDLARDTRQVELYKQRYGIEYPILVAGLADKQEASKAFPLLDRVRSYPTTIFMGADGSVRAVHTGFSGPATGQEHKKLRADFERLIEELLAQSER